MASRALKEWRLVLNRVGANRQIATATTPKMRPVSPTTDIDDLKHDTQTRSWWPKGDHVPIYVLFGFLGASICFAVHTGIQSLGRSPGVSVRKTRREILAEVAEPQLVIGESDRALNKSFFRKVAHLKKSDPVPLGAVETARSNDPENHVYKIESLQSVGVIKGNNKNNNN